jgi:hypothetical protein
LRRAQVGLRSKTCSTIVCFYAGVQRRNNFTSAFSRSYSPFAAPVHKRDGCVFPRRSPLITQPQALGRQNHTSLSWLGRNVGRPLPLPPPLPLPTTAMIWLHAATGRVQRVKSIWLTHQDRIPPQPGEALKHEKPLKICYSPSPKKPASCRSETHRLASNWLCVVTVLV